MGWEASALRPQAWSRKAITSPVQGCLLRCNVKQVASLGHKGQWASATAAPQRPGSAAPPPKNAWAMSAAVPTKVETMSAKAAAVSEAVGRHLCHMRRRTCRTQCHRAEEREENVDLAEAPRLMLLR